MDLSISSGFEHDISLKFGIWSLEFEVEGSKFAIFGLNEPCNRIISGIIPIFDFNLNQF